MLNAVVAVIVTGLLAVGAAAPGSVPPGPTIPPGPDDEVHAFGTAPFLGSTAGLELTSPLVSMAATPSGHGYWLVAADGGIFDYGDAGFLGSAAGLQLAAPIVSMAATPSGEGYWLAAADGGIFTYGDAGFVGSVAADELTGEVTAMAASPSGEGYWLATADGGVLAFGDAGLHGSPVGIALAEPVEAMAPTPSGEGYWLFSGDGGVFAYGDAEFLGAPTALPAGQRIVAAAADPGADPDGLGYWVAGRRLPRLPLRGDRAGEVPRQPALAVKIDNVGRATPQWGLEHTDLVVEEIVEGDITRFIAVFHSRGADTVGPVRSARTSDVDLLALLGRPLFAFSGGNQGVRDAVSSSNVVDLNHGVRPGAYTRTRSRPAPHNLLTSTDVLRSLDPGTPPPPQVFGYRSPGDEPAASGAPAQGIDLQVGGVAVRWRWDATTGRWLRWQRGAPHVSADGPQLGAENVVVMFTDYVPSGVDSRSPEAVSVGEGEAWVLVDGSVIAGRWIRPTAADPLQLVDGAGAEIELEPGNTWLELPRPGSGTVVP